MKQLSVEEFTQHLREALSPKYFDDDEFIFSEDALIEGLEYIGNEALEIEYVLDEDTPYFKGKMEILTLLRRIQSVASILQLGVIKFKMG